MRLLQGSFAISADNHLKGLFAMRFYLRDMLQVYQGIKAFYKSGIFAK